MKKSFTILALVLSIASASAAELHYQCSNGTLLSMHADGSVSIDNPHFEGDFTKSTNQTKKGYQRMEGDINGKNETLYVQLRLVGTHAAISGKVIISESEMTCHMKMK